jgi:predicted transcriptional regulator
MDAQQDHLMDNFLEIHLAVPRALLSGLDRVAAARGVKRASVMREALASYLERIESERIEREIETYAEALATESGEFVTESEEHVLQRLLNETEW